MKETTTPPTSNTPNSSSFKTSFSPSRPLKEWCAQDRPREKYLERGLSSLTDAELLAILLRSGTRNKSVIEVSQQLLQQSNNSLNTLSEKTMQQLTNHEGIGEVKAITLIAAFEIGKRMRVEKVKTQNRIQSAKDILDLMQDKNAHLAHEEFWVIYANNANSILSVELMGRGGLTQTITDIRLIMKSAVEQNATALFLCHNHPSGNLEPSQPDIELTRAINNAANTLNIRLLDHVIIHKNLFFSFAEKELI